MTTPRVDPPVSTSDDYPITIWAYASKVPSSLIDTVSFNIREMLNAFGIPATAVTYHRMRCSGQEGIESHLFIALDEQDRVITVNPARLAMLTSTIDVETLMRYNGATTADPLGALLLKSAGSSDGGSRNPEGSGERINRFPPVFGFKVPRGERPIFDRRPELEALRRDGYIGLTFLPIPGTDHRLKLMSEIATLWGYSLAAYDSHWPDLLVLRNDIPERDDLGGVPDETWLQHALSRVQEDHLPIVEIDGLWMGSLPRGSFDSRVRVLYGVLDWIRLRKLQYINARTFHCYVRRDLSALVALGSLRDRSELVSFLEAYPFNVLHVTIEKGESSAARAVFSSDARNIAVKEPGTDLWHVVHDPNPRPPVIHERKPIDVILRDYFGKSCGAPGSPLTREDINQLKADQLLKVVRIAECDAAAQGVCLPPGGTPGFPTGGTGGRLSSTSHRAYRSAIRTHVLRSHDTLGIYRLGPFMSPFFMPDNPVAPDKRFTPVVHQVSNGGDPTGAEDTLLELLVGKVWLLTVDEFEVVQVASDRDPDEVRQILFRAWKTGMLTGTWCDVMLAHRQTLSISVSGGTVDPLLAHAGDSIVDGNRWLDVVGHAIQQCSSSA